MILAFLVLLAELQGDPLHVDRLFTIDAPRLDRLREELVDPVRRLMVHAGVPFLEGPFELVGDLVLEMGGGYRDVSFIDALQEQV